MSLLGDEFVAYFCHALAMNFTYRLLAENFITIETCYIISYVIICHLAPIWCIVRWTLQPATIFLANYSYFENLCIHTSRWPYSYRTEHIVDVLHVVGWILLSEKVFYFFFILTRIFHWKKISIIVELSFVEVARSQSSCTRVAL